jgi:hypothetical protein
LAVVELGAAAGADTSQAAAVGHHGLAKVGSAGPRSALATRSSPGAAPPRSDRTAGGGPGGRRGRLRGFVRTTGGWARGHGEGRHDDDDPVLTSVHVFLRSTVASTQWGGSPKMPVASGARRRRLRGWPAASLLVSGRRCARPCRHASRGPAVAPCRMVAGLRR